MKSVWQETPLPRFPQLTGDAETDVLIIGGGIAGILTAYFLQQNGVKYILAEKDRICSHNTQNTTAKISVQHGLIYHRLYDSLGAGTAKKYLDANSAAFKKYAELCRDIDCDYELKDSFVYSDSKRKLNKELETLHRLGADAELVTKLPLPVRTAGAVKLPGQAQFDPLKFIAGVSGGLNIFENTFIRELDNTVASTESGKIRADRVVIATHFPFIDRFGAYFLKLYQHRSYVIALENAADVGGMYVDDSNAGLSFRNYKDLLLLGGGGGRTGMKNGGWEFLRSYARAHYPDSREKYFWAAQDCMSLDGMPYIGRYSKHTPKLFVETGFNKWGMTSSMLSAMAVSDMLLGRKSGLYDIFEPSRSILKPQLIINGAESVFNLLTPVRPRCTHLGCALKWNSPEHSWDCPCHGSRFSEAGIMLDSPANKNKNI